MKEVKIGFIGPGKMAGAIVKGMVKSNVVDSRNMYVYGIDPTFYPPFTDMGCSVSESISDLHKTCSIIFFSVKPQNFGEIAEELKADITDDKLYVSIMAGISMDKIYKALGREVKLVRTMPNTGMLIGMGVTSLTPSASVSKDELALIDDIFSAGGTTDIVTEDKIDAVIALSGSSPAYIYLFSEIIRDYCERQGLSKELTKNFFANTLIASGNMILESGYSERELITMVASKGGTTQAALDVLENGEFKAIIENALTDCINRSKELGA